MSSNTVCLTSGGCALPVMLSLCFSANVKAQNQAVRKEAYAAQPIHYVLELRQTETENYTESRPRRLPLLTYKSQRRDIIKIQDSAEFSPLSCVYYGFQEGEVRHPINSLVREQYGSLNTQKTQFFIEPKKSIDAYIFDPISLRGSEWVLFKFGRADLSVDEFGIYLFNQQTHQIKTVVDEWLNNTDIQISPNGHFISYLSHEKSKKDVDSSSKILELWVYNVKTEENVRIARGSSLQHTIK